jgi:hypothetical protein
MYSSSRNTGGAYAPTYTTSEPQRQSFVRKRKAASYAENDRGYPKRNDDALLKKSKRSTGAPPDVEIIDLTGDSPKKMPKERSKKTTDVETKVDEEKRLRRFRKHAPQSYMEIKGRALTQRLTVLNRERCGTDEIPEETIVMAGSTGNVYTQKIGLIPSCDCPHAKKGNQCKHIIYVSFTT